MNRNAIKKFATWARTHLREQITAKAARYGITAGGSEAPQVVSGGMTVAGFTYDAPTTALYGQLINDLNDKRRRGLSDRAVLESLVDEMAYTWFNRLTALRFMEVHGYSLHALSSSTPGLVDPDLLQQASALVSGDEFRGVTLDDLDRWRRSGDEEVYRNLLVAHCRTLSQPLPFLFGEGKRYAALFLPDNLLTTGSVIRRLVGDISEEDWQDIEITGWLYQFYISERKDEVFDKGGAYDARDIPAATQLFTPHWIVRYMVENSLGRLWLEAYPESRLRERMPYYLESQGENGGEKRQANPALRPEDLTVLDPACGSGHILVYAFDLLMAIYTEQGYPEREIPALILEHNLHGLDIDERAAQLASFALMMKARERSRRILRNPPALNVTHTVPTRGWVLPEVPDLKKDDWQPLLDAFRDADNLGSLITPPEGNMAALEAQLATFEASGRQEMSADAPRLRLLLKQVRLLREQYRAVVANPPYMGGKAFNKTVKDFVTSKYPRSKSDLFAVFMERSLELSTPKGIMGMINQHAWMFLSSYEALRENILDNYDLQTMIHLGPRAFPEVGGEVVQSTAFTIAKQAPQLTPSTFVRLVDEESSNRKEAAFLSGEKRFERDNQQDFEKIPGSPIAYWVSERVLEVFEVGTPLVQLAEVQPGLQTSNNERFLRLWHEVAWENTCVTASSNVEASGSGLKWFPHIKGGDYRLWYGNHDFVVNWLEDGREIKQYIRDKYPYLKGNIDYVIKDRGRFFKPNVSWTRIGSGHFGVRQTPKGFLVDVAGSALFPDLLYLDGMTGFMCSKLAGHFLRAVNPTITTQSGDIETFPILKEALGNDAMDSVSRQAVEKSRIDWDNSETSWDFQTHPLLRTDHSRLTFAFSQWQRTAEEAFFELKRLEEENNRYWIDAYGLQDELTPEVPEEQITIRRADLVRDIKSLISYAVGCMFGRYTLSTPGLQFAGGTFDPSAFSGDFLPDADGLLPLTDEAYFEDDIVSRFVTFVRVAFGPEHLEENLTFVADALSRKGNESAVARIRRYFVSEFVSDHIQMYKKRPIYWLLTSGKGKAFGALVYLHRYTPDTLASVRNDYVLPLQSKLEAEIRSTERAVAAAASASAAKAESKRLVKLREQVAELLSFHDRLLHKADQRIDIDLDDGVAYNYTLFGNLLYEGADLKLADLMKKSQWKRDLLTEASKTMPLA